MDAKVKDVRGIEIEVGDIVVTALDHNRLYERTVTSIVPKPNKTNWWVDIICGGFVTTPERCAVVEKSNG